MAAVLSIVGQTFRDWELLLIDDGSTDGALRQIAEIGDPRIQILRDGENKGLATRLNQAIDLARGQYIARMDHDDVSYPERFAFQVALLDTDPTLDVVAVRAITIADDNEAVGDLPGPLNHGEICARPWLGFYFPHPTWMGRTGWFRAHRYASPAPYFCEDQELLLRSYATSRFASVDRVLFAYRVRDRINWKKHSKTRRALFAVQWRHFLRSREYHFAILSLAAFVARTVRDASTVVLPRVARRRRSNRASATSAWQDVLKKNVQKP